MGAFYPDRQGGQNARQKGLYGVRLLAYTTHVQTVGRHLLLELYECDPVILDSVDAIRDAVRAATELSGATIVGETYHHFEPQGVSASVLIAESHVSLHTWPEVGYAAADFYTCGDIDPRVGFAHLATTLGASSHNMVEIVRGLDGDVAAHANLPADVHRIADLASGQRS